MAALAVLSMSALSASAASPNYYTSQFLQDVNVRAVAGVDVSTGPGPVDAGTQRVVLPTDQTPLPAFQSGVWSVGISSGPNSVVVTSSGSLRVYIPAPSPRVYTSSIPVVLSSITYTNLVTLNFSGEVEALAFNFDRTQVIPSIVVDGIEIFRAELADLNAPAIYNLSDNAATTGQSPIIVSRIGKQLWVRFTSPKGVGTSLSVQARCTVTMLTNMLGAMVVYGVTR